MGNDPLRVYRERPTGAASSIYKMVEIPADDLERLIRLAEVGAGGFMDGPARNAAIMTVRCAESLWVTATGRGR